MTNAEPNPGSRIPYSILRSQGVVGTQRRGNFRFGQLRREVLAVVDEAIGLELVLLVVQRAVAAAERDELRVRAALDDLALLEHEDLIRAADRREAVRDDERRAPAPQRLEAVLDHRLA